MPAAKRARVGEPTKTECTSILKFLSSDDGMTPSCRNMLQSMAPFALQATKEERHAFQSTLIEEIARLLSQEKARHDELAEAAEAALKGQCAEVEKALADLDCARETIQQNKDTKEAGKAKLDEARSTTKAAEATLADVQERKSQLSAKQQAETREATEYSELLAGPYDQLKQGTKKFDHYTAKNKSVDQVVKLLTKTGCGETLSMTMSTVLKSKVAERGDFAQSAIQHADTAFKEHLEIVDRAVGTHGEQTQQILTEETNAQEVLKSKQAEEQTAEAAWMAAEDTWCASTQFEMDKKTVVDDSKFKNDDLSKDLEKAKETCTSFLATIEHFERLRDRSSVEEPCAVESTPQDAEGAEMAVDEPVGSA